MASISTCFILTPKPYSKSSSVFCLKHSRQLRYSLRNDEKDVFRMQFLKLSQHRSISHDRRSFKFEIRASNAPSVEATPWVSPGRIIECDKLPADVRKRAMDAVDKCGRRVTVGDVASKAGIMLVEAQRALQAIAADSNGFLEVSDEGDILYVFPNDYRSKLASKSFRIRMEPYLEKAKSFGEYLVRVTFGTALIASIITVFTAILAILAGSSDDEKKERRRRSSGFDRLLDYLLSRRAYDLFWYWDPHYYSKLRLPTEDYMVVFIECVFSFVFGDGDPNEGIEEERWKMIGQYIGSNGGIVTAEELTPYLDVLTAEKTDDDSYILPVLLRFDGQPQVDKEGNILYQFPSLQRTADSQEKGRKDYLGEKFKERVGRPDKFFKENKWEFSRNSKQDSAFCGGLGGLNLFGVIVLGAMLKTAKIEPDTFISFVSKILPLLQFYAVSFLAIPLARLFLIQRKNAEIEKRNQARELRSQALELPNVSLRRKILSARDMSQRTVINEDRIVYTTNRDVSEQDYDKQEWDRQSEDTKISD